MMKPFKKITTTSPRIWLVASSFVLLQFFLQLSSGVVIGAIMQDMQLSAVTAGLLGSSFYIIYTALQIPVGLMCDRKNLRVILTSSALLCALGCLIFAASHQLVGLYLGRMTIGVGSAFAFVSLTHLVREHYPIKQFALLIGVTETFSFLVTVLGIVGLGQVIAYLGWRIFIDGAAFAAILIAYLCWKSVPEADKINVRVTAYRQELYQVLSNGMLWINGLIIGLSFTLVTVFGALWAVPFLQTKLDCSLRQASLTTALFFLGTGISCPLFGWLSSVIKQRKGLMVSSYVTTAIFLLMTLYIPSHSIWLVGGLMFLTGLCCGAYLLAYPISNELTSPHLMSTAAGFTNTLALVTTPLLQPLIGFVLAAVSTTNVYTLANYQASLTILPACLLLACLLVGLLPLNPSRLDLKDKNQDALYPS